MIKLINGDCLEEMKNLEANSIDTIITDPPYGLSFMGKKWDYDVPSIEIFEEMLRVAKPGATLLCFAGSRTQHRMAVNIEDAGWILKDCIMWLYGSGFPKATDISKQLDKGHEREVIGKLKTNTKMQGGNYGGEKDDKKNGVIDITEPSTSEAKLWNGWKSHGLKPAYEPIIVAMKPNEGTYANNALKHGVSGLNIDGGRIGDFKPTQGSAQIYQSNEWKGKRKEYPVPNHTGRFPANIILDRIEEQLFTLIDNIDIITEKVIKQYYENYKVPTMWERVQDISEQDEKVLQSDMLQQGSKELSESNDREETQKGINRINEEKQDSEDWKGKPEIQRVLSKQGVQIHKSNRIESGGIEDSQADDNKRVNSRTQDSNGDEIKQTSKELRNSSSQKRNKDGQQRGESRDNKQYKSHTVTSPVDSGKQEIEVLARDVPEAWLRYFRPTGYSVISPNSSSKMLDEQSGISKSSDAVRKNNRGWGDGIKYGKGNAQDSNGFNDKGGASRFFYTAKASKSERNAGCEGLEEKRKCYMAKANGTGEPSMKNDNFTSYSKNHHPTVKPLKLMEYLSTLTKTPTRGVVLDPFMGSGTTGIACKNTGRDFIGIELDTEYFKIAQSRLNIFT